MFNIEVVQFHMLVHLCVLLNIINTSTARILNIEVVQFQMSVHFCVLLHINISTARILIRVCSDTCEFLQQKAQTLRV